MQFSPHNLTLSEYSTVTPSSGKDIGVEVTVAGDGVVATTFSAPASSLLSSFPPPPQLAVMTSSAKSPAKRDRLNTFPFLAITTS